MSRRSWASSAAPTSVSHAPGATRSATWPEARLDPYSALSVSTAFCAPPAGLARGGGWRRRVGGWRPRLQCGAGRIKTGVPGKTPPATAAPGGINGAPGYRYWTISIANLADVVSDCDAAGYKVAVPVTEIRPGIKIAIVEDPDGNWVEFLDAG